MVIGCSSGGADCLEEREQRTLMKTMVSARLPQIIRNNWWLHFKIHRMIIRMTFLMT